MSFSKMVEILKKKEKNKLIKIYEAEGKYHNIQEKSINCLVCKGI